MNYRRFTYRLMAVVILLSMVLMTQGEFDTAQTLPSVYAQDGGGQNGDIYVSAPVTPLIFEGDLRDLPAPAAGEPREIPKIVQNPPTNTVSVGGGDALAQSGEPSAPSPNPDALTSPTRDFDGIPFQSVNPSDVNGDVGPNHFIQMTNDTFSSLVHIYDKASPTPNLLVNIAMSTIWSNVGGGGNCASGDGDPIVLWDSLADRWVLTEFETASDSLCIMVSRTPDPVSGGWYLYEFGSLPGGFPDYPKYAVWPDAYYATSNSSTALNWAFDRRSMLLGDPTTFQTASAPSDLDGFGFEAMTPADLDGSVPPPLGTPGIIMRHVDTEAHPAYSGGGQDYLEIWQFDVDFFDPSNSSFTGPIEIPIAEFDSDLCGLSTFSCIPQPSPGSPLDPLREVIMWRLVYRNFNGSQRLIGNLATDVTGSDDVGIRFFELRNTGGGWSLYQEGTIHNATGTGGVWDGVQRWMGASAMDGSGNIALGYSVSNSTALFPGIRYNGRRANDPLNTMTQGEISLHEGTGTNGSFRWGDYASMSIDPSDDCTFWKTNNYGAGGQWRTRIGTFSFGADCTTPSNTADVLVTITDETDNANPSDSLTYNLIVSNPGLSNAGTINVESLFSDDITNVSWTCVVTGTGSCPANGTVNISHAISLNAGAFATYTVDFDVAAGAPPGSTISSTVTATLSGGLTDPNPANNSGSDDNTLINGAAVIANDNFVNATDVIAPTSVTQEINGSTLEGNDPDLPCIGTYSNSVWYYLIPDGQNFTQVTATSTDYDVAIGIVSGTPGNFNVLACDNNSAGSTHATTGASVGISDAWVIVVNNNATPVAGSSTVQVSFQETSDNSALVMFNPTNSDTSALETLFSNPPATAYDNFTNNPPVNSNNEWVMGDWNGDGVETPGVFSNGAFFHTNDYGGNSDWSTGIWLGNAGTRIDLLAGRFDPGSFNNDCIAWVDANTSPITGDLRLSLKYWCDMTASGAVPLEIQFIGGILGDSNGFSGTFQIVGGDWDTDGADEVAVRRGDRIAYTLVEPPSGPGSFGQAQRWDNGATGPGGHGTDDGIFISGDWDGDGQDGWGVLYDDNDFYYRSNLAFNPGPFQFSYQQVANTFGASRQADTHRSAFGGEAIPAMGAPVTFGADGLPGGPVDTSRNVEADLSVSKAGNFQVGEVGLVGDTITWTITVANTGTAPANGVQITDNVPGELRVDDAFAAMGTVTVRGQQVSFNVPTIGVGETAQFNVVTTILAQPSSGLFNNSVNVLLPDGGSGGSDANLVASTSVNTVDGLPATGYAPKFRW